MINKIRFSLHSYGLLIYLLNGMILLAAAFESASTNINSNILLARFYLDGQEIRDSLQTGKLYLIDILAKDLKESDKVYIIFEKVYANKEILIDKTKDIKLDLSTQSSIESKFSTQNLIDYFRTLFDKSSDLTNLQVFYSSVQFAKNQSGEIGFCVNKKNDAARQCIHQGDNSFVNFSVVPTAQYNIYFVILVTLLALFVSALTSGLTLGI